LLITTTEHLLETTTPPSPAPAPASGADSGSKIIVSTAYC